MNRDEIILRKAMVVCEHSQVHTLKSKQLLLAYSDTSVIQEGVFIETGRVIIDDLIKNILSTGAVAATGALGGDTIVDVMYAIERTSQVITAYNAIKSAGGILSNLLDDIDNIPLTSDISTIRAETEKSIALIAQQYDRVAGTDKASKGLEDLEELTEEVKEEFMEFFRSIAKSISTWISTLIPDDGGNIGTFINITLVSIVEKGLENPLGVFMNSVSQLPDDYERLVFDEAALRDFLVGLCNTIADAVEEHGGGLAGKAAKGIASGAQSYYDFLGDYTPLGFVYSGAGYVGKKAGEMIGGEDSSAAKYGEAMFDPRKSVEVGREKLDALIDEFPSYIRNELIPQIPEAVETYGKFMKYILSFLSLLESTATGEISQIASSENYNQYLPAEEDFEMQQQMVAEIRRSLMMHQRRLIG